MKPTAAINGSGTNLQPLVRLQHTGVETIKIAADSGNGGAIAFADLATLEATVGKEDAEAEADARMAFVTSPALRSKLRRTDRGETSTGITLWNDGGQMLGYRAFATTSVPSTITKGSGTNLSCLPYGNFGDLVIDMFTVLDVIVNLFLQSVSGVMRVSAFLDVDVMPRHVQSFAKLVGAVTA